MRPFLIIICFIITGDVLAQRADIVRPHEASNPALVYSRVVLDLESDLFENESVFYAFKPGFYYGLKSDLHLGFHRLQPDCWHSL